MSVLSRMLTDLSARGAAPAALSAMAGPPLIALDPHAHRAAAAIRHGVWLSLAVLCAVVVAALWWLEQRARQPVLSSKPVGMATFAALTAAQPAPASSAVAPEPIQPQAAGQATATAPTAPAPSVPAPDALTTVSMPSNTPASPSTSAATSARSERPNRQVVVATPTARSPALAAAPAAAPAASAAETPRTEVAIVRRTHDAATTLAAEMARAADLIARGRSTEAAELLRGVLARDAQHAPARQALAALYGESGRRDLALAVLLDGVPQDPARFAAPAARLQSESGDLTGALATLARLPLAQRSPTDHALAAGLAYRAGQFGAAVESYQRALAAPQAPALWWVGLGLAHEAAGQRAEAHQAFSRLAQSSSLTPDVRQFITQRLAATAPQTTRRPDPRASAEAALTTPP